LTILEAAPTVTICDGALESVYVLWRHRNHRCIIIIIIIIIIRSSGSKEPAGIADGKVNVTAELLSTVVAECSNQRISLEEHRAIVQNELMDHGCMNR